MQDSVPSVALRCPEHSPSTTSSRLLPVALLLLVLLAPSAYSQAIRGSVVNGTLSQPQPGSEVRLIAHGTDNAVVAKSISDESGVFVLEMPADTTGMKLYLSTTYDGIEYAASMGGPAAHLMVYEKTSSDSTIRVTSHHIVVDAGAREVTQIVVFRNTGNRTFATGEGHGHGIEIPLPTEVSALLRGDQGVHLHQNVLVNPRPAYPGVGQLAFGFAIPSSGNLDQLLPYPTDAVDLLVTPPGADVSAESFEDRGETAFDQRNYRRYNQSGLPSGSRISLSLASVGGLDGWSRDSALPVVLAGTVLIIVGIAAYVVRQGRRTREPPVDPAAMDLQGRRQALLMQIADLDDSHAGGEISDADHESRREALKAEIVRLTQSLSGD